MGAGDAAMSELSTNNRFSAAVVFTEYDLRNAAESAYEGYREFAQRRFGAELKPWAEVDGMDRLGWVIAARLALQKYGGEMEYDIPSQEMKLTD
jgi:hypothetical protein